MSTRHQSSQFDEYYSLTNESSFLFDISFKIKIFESFMNHGLELYENCSKMIE